MPNVGIEYDHDAPCGDYTLRFDDFDTHGPDHRLFQLVRRSAKALGVFNNVMFPRVVVIPEVADVRDLTPGIEANLDPTDLDFYARLQFQVGYFPRPLE